MDVQTILLSVEERDKWRRRLEVLKSTLAEVKLERHRVERQLRVLKRELGRLAPRATEGHAGRAGG
jgi:uncharacterized coiled-coil protein SlyX